MDPGIMIPVKGYGGHERLVEMFAKEYHRLGHEVHLLVTTGSRVEGCTVHDFGKEGFPPKKVDARKAMPAAWKFLLKHRNHFHLIHNFGRLAYLLPIINHPVKKIMTYGREITGKNVRSIERLPYKNIVFTGCSDNLISRAGASTNWKTVYNAIDFNKYTLRDSVPVDAPLIFLGRIERIKGCHIAIKVALATGNKLIIAGNKSSLTKEIEYFKTEIDPFIDGKQIRYIGEVNDAQKNEYLGQSRALLFPIQWNEPFGIVMIEAMACGTPVIGFGKGSVPEVIEEGITGFITQTQEEMVQKVKQLSTISRSECRKRAKSRFDVQRIAGQYLDSFKEQKKIVIVTSGQPSANPRVVKEAIGLDSTGYRVTVLYVPLSPWANQFDKVLFKQHQSIKWIRVGYDLKAPIRFLLIRLRRKLYELVFRYLDGFSTTRYENAYIHYAPELRKKSHKLEADLYIAHNLGALPAAINAARRWNAHCAFDAEDFHRGEMSEGALYNLAAKIEDRYIPRLDYMTAASPLIAEAYENLYPGIKTVVINNAFEQKYIQESKVKDRKTLKLFWFSQFIGPERGLETAIAAVNLLSDCDITLHLLGNCSSAYSHHLDRLIKKKNCLHLLAPVPPGTIFNISAHYDVGLATEESPSENRKLCLTNKLFTYVLAGNCIVASDTPAQKKFMEDNANPGLLYKSGDAVDLAMKLRLLYENPDLLGEYCDKTLELAATTLNWEHELIKLKRVVQDTIDSDNSRKLESKFAEATASI